MVFVVVVVVATVKLFRDRERALNTHPLIDRRSVVHVSHGESGITDYKACVVTVYQLVHVVSKSKTMMIRAFIL